MITYRSLAAVLLATSLVSAPAFAQGNSGNAPGHSGEAPGNSGNAPGHADGAPGRSGEAPGHMGGGFIFSPGKSAEAPRGERVDRTSTAAIGQKNFGTVISSIRAGKSDLSGLIDGAAVNVVDVDTLIQGANRVALENALRDNGAEIDSLRDELAALDLVGVDDATVDAVVAARVEADGSLTLYVD
ncbi:MAG: hypothetical protein KF849_02860 [Rhizobiaceae bacterium]|nr:hypothetical protein [Rhizobiaceae bacterium]